MVVESPSTTLNSIKALRASAKGVFRSHIIIIGPNEKCAYSSVKLKQN